MRMSVGHILCQHGTGPFLGVIDILSFNAMHHTAFAACQDSTTLSAA